MRFRDCLYRGEIEFFFETDQFDFDDFWQMINHVMKPDLINKVQITSWTEAYSFEKDGLVYYFEEFYDDTPSRFTLRLLPFDMKHSDEDVEKLHEMVKRLEQHLE